MKRKKAPIPDRIIVCVVLCYIEITADYACYRFEKTIEDPTHPFKNLYLLGN